MRRIVTLACAILLCAGCTASQSVGQAQRAERIRLLDSLASRHPCREGGYRVLAPPTWTRAHACAVAARGVELLAASAPNEPHFAPGDTARIRAITMFRIQTCDITLDTPVVPGKVTPVWYVLNIDVPQRPRFIAVALDALTLNADDGVSVVHKGFDGTDTLTIAPKESADTLEIGSRC